MEIYRWLVEPPHTGPVMRKALVCDNVLMTVSLVGYMQGKSEQIRFKSQPAGQADDILTCKLVTILAPSRGHWEHHGLSSLQSLNWITTQLDPNYTGLSSLIAGRFMSLFCILWLNTPNGGEVYVIILYLWPIIPNGGEVYVIILYLWLIIPNGGEVYVIILYFVAYHP